ncbi:MAG TPA: hypothetical protein DEP84_25145 [Chloroflexi bacterium]|nr:hypothetical protein [Chloroflexota bacterium]
MGLTDFRGHAYEAGDKDMVVVLLAWAYVERRFASERSAQLKTYGDIIRRHRDEQAVDWLTGAVQLLQDTGNIRQVRQRFLRLPPSPAERRSSSHRSAHGSESPFRLSSACAPAAGDQSC